VQGVGCGQNGGARIQGGLHHTNQRQTHSRHQAVSDSQL
jgi:hypothetical protein